MRKCWCCATRRLSEKFAFHQLNRRPLLVIFWETAWRVAFRCNPVIPSFMLARIPKRTISALLLLAGCMALVACATEKPRPALVDDPDAKKESQIPWNKQEKWESQGQFAGMTDRR